MRDYLRRHGYVIAEVTIDFHDWAWIDAYVRCVSQKDTKSVAWLRNHILDSAERHLRDSKTTAKLLFGRDITHVMLIHDGVFEAIILNTILRAFQQNGVEFVTLREALADPVYKINPNVAYTGEGTFSRTDCPSARYGITTLADSDSRYTEEKLSAICNQSVKARARQPISPH